MAFLVPGIWMYDIPHCNSILERAISPNLTFIPSSDMERSNRQMLHMGKQHPHCDCRLSMLANSYDVAELAWNTCLDRTIQTQDRPRRSSEQVSCAATAIGGVSDTTLSRNIIFRITYQGTPVGVNVIVPSLGTTRTIGSSSGFRTQPCSNVTTTNY